MAKMPMSRVGRARERGETDGFLKAYVDAETKQILGASFLGIEADEAVQTLAPLMMAKQPYTVLIDTVMIHPTVNELVPYLFEQYLKPL
jgi:pyruvate/2-oxoglutarate dehydrogenase complex dihydrolipoamide dehydrogenase (E3) component